MGIIAKLLGSDEVIGKGMDLIDDLWETDAEKRESKTEAKIKLMKAYAPFKVTQRYLALMFGGTFLFSFFLVLFMTMAGIGDPDKARLVIDEFNIAEIMFAIILFFFGGGLLESGGRAAKKAK